MGYYTLRAQSAASLNDMSDVIITSPSDAHMLLYDSAVSAFLNKAISGDISIAKSGAVTISNLARSKLASGTPNYILVNDGSGVMSESESVGIVQGGTGATCAPVAGGNLGLRGNCILSGLEATIGAGGNTVNIAAGTAIFVDAETDPCDPVTYKIEYEGVTNLALTYLAVAPLTILSFDKNGTVHQDYAIADVPAYLRDRIGITTIFHVNNTSINAIEDTSIQGCGVNLNLNTSDLAISLGCINFSGNVYSAASNNLTIKKTAGEMFSIGSNVKYDISKPNHYATSLWNPASFTYTYQDGAGSFNYATAVTNIDPDHYDDGSGTLASVGVSKYTVQRIHITTTQTIIQYGQAEYNSIASAKEGINDEAFETNPLLLLTCIRAYLIVKKGCTDLSNSADAVFVEAGRLGISGAVGGAALNTTTLQQAYNNSNTPEIILDSTRGALTIRDAATPIAANLFEIENNAGTTNYFSVTDDNVIIGAYAFPLTDGSADQALATNGAGVLSWTTLSSGIATPTTGSSCEYGEYNPSMTGTDNTLYGKDAGDALTSASGCTAVGKDALGANTTANNHTAFGKLAGSSINGGSNSVFCGYYAGKNVTGGVQSVYVGGDQGNGFNAGNYNTAIGCALTAANVPDRAVAVGNYCGTNGDYAVGVGASAVGGLRGVSLGYYCSRGGSYGTNSVSIGYYCNQGYGLTDSVLIGYEVAKTQNFGNNSLAIHNSDSATPLLHGDFSTPELQINGTATLGQTGNTTNIHAINGDFGNTGANTATLTNSPVSGNPSGYLKVSINGSNYYIPAWAVP